MARNNLAFALGWYQQPHIANHSTAHDRNDTLIQAFIEKVDAELDSVLLLEWMPEPLLRLREEEGGLSELDLSELILCDYSGDKPMGGSAAKKKYPNEQQRQELKDMLYLDQMIYQHFQQRFHDRWNAAVAKQPELVPMRDALQCASERLQQELVNKTLPLVTQGFLSLRGADFTSLLLKRQVRKYGMDE
ncbi:MAG: hypothetical protein SGARI_000203 [Bacillariaceae sp.]